MDDLKQENELLKEYLADAIEIANFTASPHGFFIGHKLWALKRKIDQSGIALNDNKLFEVVRATQLK